VKPRRRVAITGVGMVTPAGNDTASTWSALQAGRSGLGPITTFDASGFSTRIGAEVKNFDPRAVVRDAKLLKFAARSHGFALAAATEALADAGIRPEPANSHRWACCVGAGMMSISLDELKHVHAVAAPDGEFNPDAVWTDAYHADPVAFCRNQSNAGLGLLD